MALTDYPLYELERRARRRGIDIDRLRQDYWDEMLSTGKAGQEGSVRQQALKSRVFQEPVQAEEQDAAWYEKLFAPPGSKREQALEHYYRGFEKGIAKAGEAPRDILMAMGDPFGLGTLAGKQVETVRKKAEDLPVTEASGIIPGSAEIIPEIGGELTKLAPYLVAGGPVAGFSASYAVPAMTQELPKTATRVGTVAEAAAKGAIEGTLFKAAGALPRILRMPATGVVAAGVPAAQYALHADQINAIIPELAKRLVNPEKYTEEDFARIGIPKPESGLSQEEALSVAEKYTRDMFAKVGIEKPTLAGTALTAGVGALLGAVGPKRGAAGADWREALQTARGKSDPRLKVKSQLEPPQTEPTVPATEIAPPDLTKLSDDELQKLLARMFMDGEDVTPIRAEIARRAAPVTTPEVPPTEPIKPPEQRTTGLSDLIEAQDAEAQAARAARMGITPEELARRDALGQREQLTETAIKEGTELPLAPPGEPEVAGMAGSPPRVEPPVEARPPVEPPAIAPESPRTGVEAEPVPLGLQPGREGERGSISLGMLFPSLGKAQQAQKQTAAQAIAAGAPTVLSPRLQASIDGIESRLGILAERMSKRVGDLGFANADEAAKFGDMIVNSADDVSLRGWTKTERAQRQAAMARAPREQTHSMGTSERDVQEWTTTLTTLAKELDTLNRQSIAETGMSLKDMGGQQLYELLGRMHRASDIQGTAAGRTLAARRQSAAVIASLAKQFGWNLNGLKVAMSAERDPIYTSLVQAAKDFTSATSGEARTKAAKEFGSKFTDAWRMNLFTVGSWTLDMVGNLFSLAMETPGIIGEDVARALRGDVSLASSRGAAKALLTGRFARRAPLAVEQSLGMATAGGERVSGKMFSTGKGAFTRGVVPGRSAARNAFSVAVDKIAGAPLYAKAAFDTGFKRLGAMAAIYRDATLRANAALKSGKIKPDQYDAYVQQLVQKPDAAMVESATALANKLGFNRPLYQGAEALAKNPLYKLFGAAFGRWPFQMTAALAEWVGMNPGAWKAAAQSGRPGALVGQLAKAATGIGGLALLNKSGIYERMDWKTMEYVQEDGDRVRIGGREPLATGMTLLTMLRGDEKAFLDSLKFSSVPFAGLISGDGGLLSSVVTKLRQAQERRDLDPKALSKEASRLLAKMIPGQALLAALKVAFDPVAREQDFPAGIGAELPGVSTMLPPQIDPTTGEPRKPTQRILGSPEIPAAGGVVVPGAERALSPVHQLLSAYGLMNYKMPRRPLPMMGEGVDPKMDPTWQRRWYELYGTERVKTLGPITEELLEKRKGVPFGSRVRLLDEIKSYNKLIKGGLSSEEAGDRIWGKDWKSSLNIARQLEGDLKIIQKRDQAAMDAAFQKLTAEMRRARRERRQ